MCKHISKKKKKGIFFSKTKKKHPQHSTAQKRHEHRYKDIDADRH